jgi:AcrR family transcriptional regulator
MSATHETKGSTRERLIESARACLLEHGHAACSVKRIAAHAGVNHGLVHHYFGSKEGLLLAVIEREAEGIRDSLRRAPPGLVHSFYKPQMLRHPDRMRLAVELLGLAKAVPGVAEGLREHFRLNREALQRQLGIAEPELATLVFGALFGMAIQSTLDPTLPVEGAAERLLSILRAQTPPHPVGGPARVESERQPREKGP